MKKVKVTDRYPLKQGLKQDELTRDHPQYFGHRPISTKTRIETTVAVTVEYVAGVTDRYPLKQGLKLFIFLLYHIVVFVTDRYPLKQGLKHRCPSSYAADADV